MIETIFLAIPAVLLGLIFREVRKERRSAQARHSNSLLGESWTFEETAKKDSSASPRPSRGTRRIEDPLSSDGLRKICREFRIRRLSLLVPVTREAVRRSGMLAVLVEFEKGAKQDYSVSFRLPQELFLLFGQKVRLEFKVPGQAEPTDVRVLYAA